MGSGVSNGGVNAIAIADITHIYVGGNFSSAGGVSDTSNIAMWDGEDDWSSVGGGVNATVQAIIVDGSDIYVGGYFTHAALVNVNYIAKWDGSDWEALDGGVSSTTLASNVRDITISGTDLYVAGFFTAAGSPPTDAAYVALCDFSETPDPVWSAIGDLGSLRADFGNTISTVAVLDSMVYVGGFFNTFGDGSPASYLARWDGSVWEDFGNPDGSVIVIAQKPGSSILYIGGYFGSIGGISASRIVECDLTDPENPDWSALGDGLTGSGIVASVNAVAFSGTDVYVGGQFDTAGTVTAYNIAVWDGADWSALGTGGGALASYDRVNAIGISGTDVYIGGNFINVPCEGSVTASYLVIWDSSDSKWYQVSSDQLTAEVYAMDVLDSTHIYVGGNFWSSGEEGYLDLSRIARWDGSDWYDLEGGLNGTVFAINAVSTSEIYVGGDFRSTNDEYIELNKIAKLDDSGASAEWAALGNGVGWSDSDSWSSGVRSIAVDGSDIYVAGGFLVADGDTKGSPYLAKYGLAVAGDADSLSKVSAVMDGSDIHLVYTNEADDIIYRKFANASGEWGPSVTVREGTVSNPALSINILTHDLHLVWSESNSVYYDKGTYSSGSITWSPYFLRLYSGDSSVNVSVNPEVNASSEILVSWTVSGTESYTVMAQIVSVTEFGSKTIETSSSTLHNIEFDGFGSWELQDSLVLDGYLLIGGTSFLYADGNDITTSGDWTNYGAFIPGDNAVTFSDASGTQLVTSEISGTQFNDFVHSGGATLQLSGNGIKVGGNFTNSGGTFNANGNTVTFNGSGISNTITASNAAFYAVAFDNASGIWTLQNNLQVSDDFSIVAGTVSAGTYTITVGGDWNHSGGTFDYGTSTVKLTGSDNTITVSTSGSYETNLGFYSLTIDTGAYYELTAGFTLAEYGTLTLKGELYIPYGVTMMAYGGSVVMDGGALSGDNGLFEHMLLDDLHTLEYTSGTISVAWYRYIIMTDAETNAKIGIAPYESIVAIFGNAENDMTCELTNSTGDLDATVLMLGCAQPGYDLTLDLTGYEGTVDASVILLAGDNLGPMLGLGDSFGTVTINAGAETRFNLDGFENFGNLSMFIDTGNSGDPCVINASSSTWNIGGSWQNVAGTLGFNAETSTVIFDGSATQVILGENVWYNLTIANTAAEPGPDAVVVPLNPQTVTNTISVIDGAWGAVSGDDYNNFSIGKDGLVRAIDDEGVYAEFTVSGDWTNYGSFDHNNSTVILDGDGTQTIYGATVFYNLTKEVASEKTLRFDQAYCQIIEGTLTLNGDTDAYLNLRSTTDGKAWVFYANATDIDWVDVQDSYNFGTLISPTNYTDSGHNYNWFSGPDSVWTGAESSDWDDPDNWTGGVPTTGEDVLISAITEGNYHPILNMNTDVLEYILIDGGAVLTVGIYNLNAADLGIGSGSEVSVSTGAIYISGILVSVGTVTSTDASNIFIGGGWNMSAGTLFLPEVP